MYGAFARGIGTMTSMSVTDHALTAIAAADGSVSLIVRGAGTEVSPHTGRDVRIVCAATRVASFAADGVSVVLAGAEEPGGEIVDEAGGRWSVIGWRRSHDSPDGLHTFTVELRELEELRPNRVEVADLEVRPVRYEETVESGALILTMRVHLNEDQMSMLRDLLQRDDIADAYMPVLRVGLEERTRSMRFGKVLWQRGAGGVDARIVLVERTYDQQGHPRRRLNEPELTHALTWVAVAAAEIDALFAELRTAGVLSAEAETRVRAAGDGAYQRRQWDLCEVDDLDHWT